MFTIKLTDEFPDWFDGLKVRLTKQRLNVQLRKAMLGNLGDVKPVVRALLKCANTLDPAGA